MKQKLISALLAFVLAALMILPAAASPAEALKDISYYGDLSNCKMTAQQAEAFAAVIRSEEENRRQYAEECMEADDYSDYAFDNQVAFVDTGNGVPAMLFFSSMNEKWGGQSYDTGYNSLWQWKDGKAERFLPPTDWLKEDHGYPEGLYCHLYSDHILVVEAEYYMYGQIKNLAVFPFRNGQIAATPSTTAFYLFGDANAFREYAGVVDNGVKMCFEIDGKTVSESEVDSWMQRNGNGDRINYYNNTGALAGYDYVRQGAYSVWGMSPAREVITALNTYAAPTTGQCGDNVSWNFDESTGVLTISGTGPMWDYSDVMAVSEDFYPLYEPYITDNAPAWYAFQDSIREIHVTSGVTHIGDHAFQAEPDMDLIGEGYPPYNGFSKLTTVKLADSVSSIGTGAFAQCGSLSDVSLGKGLQEIGEYAFSICWSLKEVTLPSGLKTVGSNAFLGVPLPEIRIPRSVTSIGDKAFDYCYTTYDQGLIPAKGFTVYGEPGSAAEVYYNRLLSDYSLHKQSEYDQSDYPDNFGPDDTVYFVPEDQGPVSLAGILGDPAVHASNGQWNVTVPLQNLDLNATVICGLYNGDGKMLDVDVEKVTAGSESVAFTLDKADGGKTVRVFLLSAESAPLDQCTETDLPAA